MVVSSLGQFKDQVTGRRILMIVRGPVCGTVHNSMGDTRFFHWDAFNHWRGQLRTLGTCGNGSFIPFFDLTHKICLQCLTTEVKK